MGGAYFTVGTPEDDFPIRVLTSIASEGSFHENSGALFAYHFDWSGWVVEIITGALPLVTLTDGV